MAGASEVKRASGHLPPQPRLLNKIVPIYWLIELRGKSESHHLTLLHFIEVKLSCEVSVPDAVHNLRVNRCQGLIRPHNIDLLYLQALSWLHGHAP
jgi:hypothetical protein